MNHLALSLGFAGLVTSGCAGVVTLNDGSASAGGVVTTSTGTGAGDEGGGSGAGGAAIVGTPVCASWKVGAPAPLEGPISSYLGSVIPHPDGALIGYRSFDPGNGPSRWLSRRLDPAGLALGSASPIHSFPGNVNAAFDGPFFAVGEGMAASFGWDIAEGCGMVSLAPDGSTDGPRVQVSPGWCERPRAHKDGFSMIAGAFDTNAASLLRIDPAGVTIAEAPLPDIGFIHGRVDFEDGSFLLAWSTDGGECDACPLHVVARRFDRDGAPLAPPQPVFEDPVFGFMSDHAHVVLTRVGKGALLTWSAVSSKNSGAGTIHLLPLDHDGKSAGEPFTISAGGLPLAAFGAAETASGDLVMAWARRTDFASSKLFVEVRSPSGQVLLDGAEIVDLSSSGALKVAPTTGGALVIATAGPGAYAVPIHCGQ